ncbi:amidohydrolase family protein [Sphingomonas sp. CCH16-B10]|uniref:amidohydrolase family protein n=1 Tax=Sphingomonas sp. CCH16-B10 TaxID=1768755 RepID=UPI0009E7EB80|nr:amidohydrolase family protein [Sphingomonas sp. CCH16-B10]
MRTTLMRLAGSALAFAAFPAAAQTVAITNAKLVVGDGSAPVEGGTVVIRDGRVVAAGAGVAAPAGMRVIDAGGRWVSPGIVAGFSRVGLVDVDGVRETDDSAAADSVFNASLDIAPAVNWRGQAITLNRSEGITRAVIVPDTGASIFGGQGAMIDLGNDTSPITRARNALFEARDYARNPASFNDRGKDALLTRADAAALVPVVNGQQKLLIKVDRALDIQVVLGLKREMPALDIVLVGAVEGWMVAREIAAAGVPVIANALADLPADFDQLGATQSNVGRMVAAGVTVAIGNVDDNEARQARHVKQFAGNLVALTRVPGATGLDWGQAFATISSKPAEIMGMGGELGSLRPGRRGDVVIWDADPLEIGATPTAVFIDGVEQPLGNRQLRLRDRYLDPKEGALPKAYQH